MTRPKQNQASGKKKKTGKPRDSRYGTYVYCIVESPDSRIIPDSAPAGLEAVHKLEQVSSAGLAAIVSRVPLSQYGEEAIDANLSDAGWAAKRAMRHEQVVEFFASRGPFIPLRFGTIYLDRKSIERMLALRAPEFRRVMKSLRGKQEWGVFIYCNHTTLISNNISKKAEIQPLLERAAVARPGQQYLLAKQIEALKAKAAREEVSTTLIRMKEALDASSEQSISGNRERRRTEHGELIARLSFLVQAGRFARFRAAAERLALDYLSSGFHIEIVGPMPPYSFVNKPNTRAPAG
jgi:hypothetical protein